MKKLVLLGAALAASLCLAGTAYADQMTTVKVWENATSFINMTTPLNPVAPITSPTAIFMLTNPSGNTINFNSFGSTDYTLQTFLKSGGDTVLGNGSGHLNDGINNDVFQFTGTTYLNAGTYTIHHDDGMYLWLNNKMMIDSGLPTSDLPSSFTIDAAGTYNFNILYGEVNGSPATLYGDMPTVTPEPGSLLLLGTGILGLAVILFRKAKPSHLVLNM